MTEKTEPEKINVVVLCLTVAALSVWGAFSQAGQTHVDRFGNTVSLDLFCHGYGESSRGYMIALMVLVGATLALYGQKVGGMWGGNSTQENWMYTVMLAAHVGLILTTWLLYLDILDGADDTCNEFIGRQNMFINIAFVAITVSLTYLLDVVVKKINQPWSTALYQGLLYGGIVFLFFFYATAPESGAGNFENSHQQQWTLITSIVVLVMVFVYCFRKETQAEKRQNRGQNEIYKYRAVPNADDESYFGASFATWFKIANGIVAAVVFVNWLLAILIVEHDLEQIANNASHTNSSSHCFADHADVLHMNMTSTGFWTLYIILLTAAFIQSVARALHNVTSNDNFTRHGPFVYTDKKDGWNMPTVIIVFTWVWILVALIVHHSEYTAASCGYDAGKELAIMILHSIGVLVVVVLLPLYYNNHTYNMKNIGKQLKNATQSELTANTKQIEFRPNNRFTTKAQVAVDVNTPLNFA